MPRYETSNHTPWSVERAFAYMSDLRHFEDWDPGVSRSVQVIGTEPRLGAAYDVTVSSPGPNLTLRYETVGFDAPRRIEVRAESRTLLSIDTITVTPDGATGATVTYAAELSLRGTLGIANPILGLAFNRIGDRAAHGLRQAIEGTET